MSAPRVLLIDANVYVIRAWQDRFRGERTDARGHPVDAVHGFSRTLLRLLAAEWPVHVAVAFDGRASATLRQRLYPGYKAGRPAAPAALRRQFVLCRALTRRAGLATFARPRVEADDVLATLASHMRAHGLRHTIVTGDKDLAQLVRTGDRWWDFDRDVPQGPEGIRRRWGVLPHQIPDLLALAGDASDKIPGVAGIGASTAARLLAVWGDLDTLLGHTAGVRKMRHRGAARTARRLEAGADRARDARRLTGTFEVAGLPEDPAALARRTPDRERLRGLIEAVRLPATEASAWLGRDTVTGR